VSSVTQDVLAGYRDPKRYGWWLALLLPLVVWFGPLMYLRTGRAGYFYVVLAFYYVVIPLLDFLVGRDASNPPAGAFDALEQDLYYRTITWLIVPFMYLTWIWMLRFGATHPLPWWAYPPLIMGIGSVGGFCINVAHEMGHRNERLERWLTKLVLAPSAYGHFTIDHNRGHHREVSTIEDHASAQMGESIYEFALRELPGAFTRAWDLESKLLARKGRSAWSWNNEILQTLAITGVLWSAMSVWLGWRGLALILLSSFWANFQLTSANYIEHYGLLRKKLPGGRYEPCEPRHSWNSDFKISNYALLHLQRHSDHHAWPTRPYQVLRHFDNVPEMPNGYFGMFVLSYWPPFWFWIMNRQLVNAVEADSEQINFLPRKRTALMKRYFSSTTPRSGKAEEDDCATKYLRLR
jgi:alkane 1-monooxygenase